MTLDEIKTAVDNNQSVYWMTEEYRVGRYPSDQNVTESRYPSVEYFISDPYGVRLDLTWSDGITLHGNESDFKTTE
jgi:hypothetical protein